MVLRHTSLAAASAQPEIGRIQVSVFLERALLVRTGPVVHTEAEENAGSEHSEIDFFRGTNWETFQKCLCNVLTNCKVSVMFSQINMFPSPVGNVGMHSRDTILK